VSQPRRGPWAEVDLRDDPEALVLVHPGWTNDRESLVPSIKEAGWFHYGFDAFRAAETAQLKWGFIGVDEELNVVVCSADGDVVATGETVTDVLQVTLALIDPERPDLP